MIARLLFGTAFCIASYLPPALFAQMAPLPYRPAAAEYSLALNRIVMVSGNPNALHIYDPVLQTDTSVALAQPPLSLSLSPDGLFAAVGHDALVSYVNLTAAKVEKTYPVTATVKAVILSKDWIHVLANYGGGGRIELATGNFVKNSFYGTGGRLNVAVNAIYGTRDGTSPNDVQKYDIASDRNTDSPYHGDYAICGPVWFSPDGVRIYTGCGTIFRASSDPTQDMRYLSSFNGVNRINALAEAGGRIALIPESSGLGSSQPGNNDSRVLVFNSDYLTPVADFMLRPFVIGGKTYRARGRWIFFSADPNELWALVQAEFGSGLLNDFAVERIRLDSVSTCAAAFESASAEVGPLGARSTLKISAAPDCAYRASTSFGWIQIVSGGSAAGDGMLTYDVLPNPSTFPRAGHIALAGRTFTVTQAAAPASAAVKLLPFDVVDAAYDKPLDRLILAGTRPNALHIYDPVSHSDETVALPLPPMSVSVRPDGLYAAVGHDGWVSYVNLQTRTIERTFTVNTDVKGIILAGNGYMYLFPARDWSDIYSLEIASGKITATSAIYNGRVPRQDSTGKYLYVGGNWTSKWDISQGIIKPITRWFSGDFSSCGNLWLTEDGARIFSACAKAYTVSPIPELDAQYNGKLSAAVGLVWADESLDRRITAVIPKSDGSVRTTDDRQIQFYDDEFLRFRGAAPLPQLVVGSESYPVHGRFAFWNRAADTVWAVVKLDGAAGSLTTFGVVPARPEDAYDVSVNAIVNAASQAPGRIAKGQIVTIYGVNLGPKTGVGGVLDPVTKRFRTELAGSQVFFGSYAGPILYASSTQINVVVPYELWSQEVEVQAVYNGIRSPVTAIGVAGASPALFTMDSSGTGQAVAIDQNGIICDAAHPALRGSYVTIYFNGGGDLNPPGVTGAITMPQLMHLRQNTAVTVGGQPVEVTFAGASPGFVNSVGQLNIKLPDNTPIGDAVPVIMTIGINSSSATATIAVR